MEIPPPGGTAPVCRRQPELYFLGVGGQFHDLVKRIKNLNKLLLPKKIDYVRAEHAPEERLGSRPTRGQRSACRRRRLSPRARTPHWKWAG